jgi:Circularly permutated YpsA SLOG family
MLRKIISGGQTGADRAGLDFAIHAGVEHGDMFPGAGRQRTGESMTTTT